ncbi:IS3 family transposase [Paenibacillus borealis]|uniref:IS3 family transposase n=1 Tax=Paenibacillus borealis TaxID=160799 RepID=UPI0009DE5F8D|nr:IS3 family transposase [Paenibacillus borealis]
MGIASSTYYDRKQRGTHTGIATTPASPGRPHPGYSLNVSGEKISDEQIQEWLMELVEGEENGYGYKLLTQCLRDRRGLILDKKKVYRLCKELGILHQQRPAHSRYPRHLARNRIVTGPNQLWQMDIKYGYVMGRDRFFFVLSLIDVFDRVIVGYYQGSSCDAAAVVQTLERALRSRLQDGEAKPVIRTDNGPQFLSHAFGEVCEKERLEHERIPPKTPNMNAYIESFHSLLERDLFQKTEYETFEEAYASVDQYMDFYNHRRLHGSLRRKPPLVFSEWVMQLADRTPFYRTL